MKKNENFMSEEMFSQLLDSVQEAVAISKGEKSPSRVTSINPIDIKQIREKTNKTQLEFANMVGINVGTLRNWEQGIRKPAGAAVSLLRLVAADPSYAEKILCCR